MFSHEVLGHRRGRLVLGRRRDVSALMVVLLMILATLAFVFPSTSMSTPQRRFGFWVSGNVIGPPKYSPYEFASAMFLTPPYPSSGEFMMFGPSKDIGHYPNPAVAPDVAHDISNLQGIASVTDSYPSIELNVMVALGNLGNPLALTYFDYYVTQLASHPSIYSIGIEGEYSSNVTVANETPLMQAAQAAGKQYIDYYKTSGVGNIISHTNWPMDNNWAFNTGSEVIGFSAGYDSNFPFPGTCAMPSDPANTINNDCGWTQSEEQFIINQSVTSFAGYQFIQFTAGADASGSFTGVSGQTTTQMWDNPTLRNWIWTDPNYQGNFVLSTSAVTSSSSTTSSTTTSLTGSSSTTASTTSIQTSTTSTTTSTTTQTSQSQSITNQSTSSTSSTTEMTTVGSPSGQGSLSIAYLALPVAIVLVGAGIVLGPELRRRTIRRPRPRDQ